MLTFEVCVCVANVSHCEYEGVRQFVAELQKCERKIDIAFRPLDFAEGSSRRVCRRDLTEPGQVCFRQPAGY